MDNVYFYLIVLRKFWDPNEWRGSLKLH